MIVIQGAARLLIQTMTKEEFRQIRKQMKMTQAQLAEEMGYSASERISEKETGIRSITARDVIMLKQLMKSKES